VNRKKSLILKTKKFLIFSLFNIILAFCFAYSTIPPSPEQNENLDEIFEQARRDFLKGDLNSAYKNLLLTFPLKNNKEWQELYFLTLIGIDKPLSAISFLQEQKDISEKSKFYLETLLEREGIEKAEPIFAEYFKVTLPQKNFKKISSIIESKNNFYVLIENSFYKIAPQGKILETTILNGARELLLLENGEVAVLTKDSIIIQGKKIVLPLEIKSALSFAKAPENCIYVLDEDSKLFMLNMEGNIIQERQLLIKRCLKIRTDSLFRVFILSANDEVSVYSSSFAPLFIMDGNPSVTGLGKIKEFFVDYAGNPIFLDRKGELFFFNFKQELLGKSQKETTRTDCFHWDGGKYLLSFDKKTSILRKLYL